MRKKNLFLLFLSLFFTLVGAATASAVEFYFGGQYRVLYNAQNFGWGQGSAIAGAGSAAAGHAADLAGKSAYEISDNTDGGGWVSLRFRPTFITKFSDRVSAELQAEIGHVRDSCYDENLINGAGSDCGAPGQGTYGGRRGEWQTRHAAIKLQLTDTTFFSAGILPYTPKLGAEMLASGDWDFNLLGLYFVQDLGFGKAQIGTAKMRETYMNTNDTDYYFFDFDTAFNALNFGVSAYWMDDQFGTGNWAADTAQADQVWTGARASYAFGNGMALNAQFIVSTGNSEGVSDNTGWLGHAQLVVPVDILGGSKISFQGLYSSGDDAADAHPNSTFYTIAPFGEGYWSYTGIATPHGPSDTDDLVTSVYNNGQGLTTIQGKFDFPIIHDVDGTFGVGWYRASHDNIYGKRGMGTDVLAQVKWVIDRFEGGALSVEAGGSYMATGDYYATSKAGANADNLYQAFSRFQVEW